MDDMHYEHFQLKCTLNLITLFGPYSVKIDKIDDYKAVERSPANINPDTKTTPIDIGSISM